MCSMIRSMRALRRLGSGGDGEQSAPSAALSARRKPASYKEAAVLIALARRDLADADSAAPSRAITPKASATRIIQMSRIATIVGTHPCSRSCRIASSISLTREPETEHSPRRGGPTWSLDVRRGSSALHHRREIGPLLNPERADIAHGLREPGPRAQGLDRRKEVRHVFVLGDVEAALNAAKTVIAQNGADFGVGLRHAFGVVGLGFGDRQVKGDGIRSARFRMIQDSGEPVFGMLASLDHRDIHQPIAVRQFAQRPPYLVFRTKRAKTLDLAGRNGCFRDRRLRSGQSPADIDRIRIAQFGGTCIRPFVISDGIAGRGRDGCAPNK